MINENQLDTWVRGNAREAQATIVELVWRLVAASCPKPKDRRFPLGDSIEQQGPDGLLYVDLSFEPFVPEGRSFWEIGTGEGVGRKATSDYGNLVRDIPKDIRLESTFVFVTPLSGRKGWKHTWKRGAQAQWLNRRRKKHDWRDVRVIDGTKLVDWLHQFPPVMIWLAQRILGVPSHSLETTEHRWQLVRTYGEPPPLSPALFLTGRDDACDKLKELVSGTAVQLKIETHFPDQVVNFVSAYLEHLDPEARVDALGRWLIVSSAEAWERITSERTNLVLIAASALDLTGDAGTRLIQMARRNGHAVIFAGPAGGLPDPASVHLRVQRLHQIQSALQEAGYKEERARSLAQKSGGNLGSLLRCVQNLSLMPEWAAGTAAADLAIANALGSWSESSSADRAIAESISGKGYGEWIGRIRELASRPGTPLTHWDGNWRFAARYEGWYALGPRLFDDDLMRLRAAIVLVLKERDPQFDLPKDERFAAGLHGKALAHSSLLRRGLADSLALLGSHSKALTSCTVGKPEIIAALIVRDTIADADAEGWASLNDHLPLLAEAAPGEFLSAFESALAKTPCPFDRVFSEEGDGFPGRTYISGVLWALETLAWDPVHFNRVVMALAELAAKDPGGRWSNRPANSLSTILLPWLPQTCAPVAKRATAISALLAEFPEVGWKLLLSLLPQFHSSSSGTRRPAWRETIPQDWRQNVTKSEYAEQVDIYAQMAIGAAKGNPLRLGDLIERIENLPPSAQAHLLSYIRSDPVVTMSEAGRLPLWTKLVEVETKHRIFPDARWVMSAELIAEISAVAGVLAPEDPSFRHRRLFSDREMDLYEHKGNFDAQRSELEQRRQKAIEEVVDTGGLQAVLAFTSTVQSPWRVGISYGVVAEKALDNAILPNLLESEHKELVPFTSGYIWSRFRTRGGWAWVDSFETSQWTSSRVGQFLSDLPFVPEAWERSKRLLGPNEAPYWSKTSAIPYDAATDLTHAIDELVRYARPRAALRCLYNNMMHGVGPVDSSRAARVLLASVASSESSNTMDTYETTQIIKAMQADPSAHPEDVFRVEWAYLPLLNRYNDATPTLLNNRLATEPEFFCEVIRVVFRSKKDDLIHPSDETKNIATNAYRLLSEWQTPPGWLPGGAFDGDAFNQWLVSVREECESTGHLEAAMTMVGHVLIHVPADPDGLWIHRSAAAALNAKDAADMRDGFQTELYNSRGGHWVDPTGTQERDLATKYRAQANDIENAGYQRLATTLRALGDSYAREEIQVVARSRFDS